MSDEAQSDSDSTEPIDKSKRRFLVGATATVGVLGVAAAATPFVKALTPDRAAEAAGGPVEVKVGKMKPGDQLTVIWRGKPIWIICRDEKMLATLSELSSQLRDPTNQVEQQPDYIKSPYRSINPRYLVLVGVCTHLGCSPTYRPDPKGVGQDWLGGFFCSCHGSKFDLAGRVFKGVPAPANLEVPDYFFADDETIVVGVRSKEELV